MIKKNVKIKKQLTLEERINMINYLSASYFLDNGYTPYYREVADTIMFFTHCVTGLTFEEVTNEDGSIEEEPVYEAVTSDKRLMNLYNNFLDNNEPEYEVLHAQLTEINSQVNDIVGYEKMRNCALVASNNIINYMRESKE